MPQIHLYKILLGLFASVDFSLSLKTTLNTEYFGDHAELRTTILKEGIYGFLN